MNPTKHDGFLDGLRGIAILIVLAAHGPVLPWETPFLGRCGVYLFFVLSAFLLTRQLCWSGLNIEIVTRYFLARIFRIYPIFIPVLLYEVLVGFDFVHRMPIDLAWRHLTLREGVFVYWTIVVEFQYYFAIPVLVGAFLLIGRKRWPISLALALVLLVLSLRHTRLLGMQDAVMNNAWLYFPSFLFGSVAGIWAANAERIRLPLWLPLAALGALWLSLPNGFQHIWQVFTDRPLDLDAFFPLHSLQGALWTIVLLGGFQPFWRTLLENPVLRFYGRISYSLYLCHQLILSAIVVALNSLHLMYGWLFTGLYILIPTGVAYLSYRHLEQPTIRFGKQFANWIFAGEPIYRSAQQMPRPAAE